MSTKKSFTKYLALIAIIAMSTLMWGCSADIDTPVEAVTVTSISVTGAEGAITVIEGSSLQMGVAVLPAEATDKSVTWSLANDTGTATIDTAGLLTATGNGTVTVKATANDGSAIEGTQVITITQFTGVTGITVTASGGAIQVIPDEPLQMLATVLPLDASDPSVTWSVEEYLGAGKGIATISETGLLSGTVAGTVVVKATANDSTAIEGTKEIAVNNRPFITSTFPIDLSEGVAITTNIEASFNESMEIITIIPANFTVSVFEGATITGTVSYDALTKTATFNPDADLLSETKYSITVTSAVTDSSGLTMLEDKVWTFTTAAVELEGDGPALINMRTASHFAILAKSAVTNTGNTLITGDIGVSPAALSDLKGFLATLSLDGTSATSSYVTGKIYTSDMKEPTPSTLTTAISDVEAAYVEAAGRVDYPVQTGLYGGIIDGKTFAPGIYKWDSVVTMATDITLQGGINDVWIFQVADTLTASSGAKVLLAQDAQAKNIFWQVAGIVTLGTGSHFEGIIMGQTQIVLETGSSVHGQLLAQTQVTLDTATVTPL